MENQVNPREVNNIWWAVAIILVLIVGIGIYQFSKQPSLENYTTNISNEINGTTSSTSSATTSSTSRIKYFTVKTENFSFSPKQITVNRGDTVRITINNQEGTHDFVLDEFDVKSRTITGSGTTEVQFIADQTGSFEYYCSIDNHRQMGMVGTLVVR